MEPSPEERDAILAALPPAALAPELQGGVASVIVQLHGRVLDAAVRLTDPPRVSLRPLPTTDAAALAAFVELLERRRAQLAHELSGPATGVMAALETVLEYEPIPEGTRALLDDARAGMIRLSRLAEDRGGLWSAEANVVEEPLAPLLARWVDDVRATLDPVGDRLEVEIRVHGDSVPRCDAALAEGALCVLLTNAWRFRSGQRVRVRVECASDHSGLRLSVQDDGRGMDDQTLEAAGTLGFSARPNGVGIGLFSLRWVGRRSGATVVLQRAAPAGARATVFLPVNSLPAP